MVSFYFSRGALFPLSGYGAWPCDPSCFIDCHFKKIFSILVRMKNHQLDNLARLPCKIKRGKAKKSRIAEAYHAWWNHRSFFSFRALGFLASPSIMIDGG
jgi:hypothetical protein